MHKPLALIVEDDKAVRNLLSTALEMHGYQCRSADVGWLSIQEVLSHKPQIILLDLGLPDMDGVEVIKKVRSWSKVPIIVVSARGEDKDKIEAFDAGADDYVTKPFSVDELLARIRTALRRVHDYEKGNSDNADRFVNSGLVIDYPAGCVFLNDKEVHLTPLEYKLLGLLAKNVGRVLTYRLILKELWGEYSVDDTAHLRVFMATLRKKIEGGSKDGTKYFQTHIGVGYRMLKI